jgi:MFS family permease
MNTARSGPPASLYVAGPFSMGYVDFFTFLIPLYGLSLGLDAAEIGILVGARSILALFLSIHIGVSMDRFGTRRVTLFFVWTGMALAPLFPLVPGFWALLLLQLVNGAAVSFAWSGAQTLIAQLAEGDAGYIGKFSFFARLGSTTAPILAGLVWDFGGAWPAYLFGAAWGAVLTIALLRTPEPEIFRPRAADGTGRARFRARDALPRASDYVSSIMLVVIPAIAVSMAIISMRNTTYSIQTLVYVVYLEQIGLVGTTIGILFATAEISSGFGSFFAGRAMRLGDPQRTMLSGTVLSILLIAMTPLLGGIFALLLLSQAIRGWLEGVIQPVILSVQARAVGRHQQCAVVGLRQTGQRLTSIVIPPLMGGIADSGAPDRRQHANLARGQYLARAQHGFAARQVAAGKGDELSRCRRPAHLDPCGAAVIPRFGVLDHDDGVGCARHHPAGRNQRRGAGCDGKLRHRAGSEDLAVQGQSFRCTFGGAHRIVGTHREPVDAGSIEPGNVDIGDNRTRQYAGGRLRQRHGLGAERVQIEKPVKPRRSGVAVDDVEKLLLASEAPQSGLNLVHGSNSAVALASSYK